MSGTRFKIWMQRAAADVLKKPEIDLLCAKFLAEAARDAGGERVYIPTGMSQPTADMAIAMKLAAHGFGLPICRAVLGDSLSASSFYRWRRHMFDAETMRSLVAARRAPRRGFVYALGFSGVGDDERFVKVGMTTNVSSRVSSFASKSPLRLMEVGLLGVDETKRPHTELMHAEREAHLALADCRLNNEWFKPERWMDDAMDALERVGESLCTRYTLTRV